MNGWKILVNRQINHWMNRCRKWSLARIVIFNLKTPKERKKFDVIDSDVLGMIKCNGFVEDR